VFLRFLRIFWSLAKKVFFTLFWSSAKKLVFTHGRHGRRLQRSRRVDDVEVAEGDVAAGAGRGEGAGERHVGLESIV
jgi:hypothetical protein